MRQRFTSSSVHKVDGKGRVSVPAGFRRVLEQAEEQGLALISNFRNQGYIEGYTQDELFAIHADIEKMKRFSPARLALEHEFITKASFLPLDDNGRILLTKELREDNGLSDTAVFAGSGRHFQIRSPATWQAHQASIAAALGPDQDPFALLPGDDGGDMGL
jgi:MraZ protein